MLGVCKNGGGKPGPFYHVNEVSVYRGGWGGGLPKWRNELEAFTCSFHLKHWGFERLQSEKRTTPGSKRRTRVSNASPHPTPVCLPSRHWHHSRDKMDQAFPLHFCILKAIKTGQWVGLEMRLGRTHLHFVGTFDTMKCVTAPAFTEVLKCVMWYQHATVSIQDYHKQ